MLKSAVKISSRRNIQISVISSRITPIWSTSTVTKKGGESTVPLPSGSFTVQITVVVPTGKEPPVSEKSPQSIGNTGSSGLSVTKAVTMYSTSAVIGFLPNISSVVCLNVISSGILNATLGGRCASAF